MFAGVSGPSFIFWPVGTGDSTTVVISETEVMQVDLNDKLMADEEGNEHIPIVDEHVAKLPQLNGRPYLSCFTPSPSATARVTSGGDTRPPPAARYLQPDSAQNKLGTLS